MTASIHPLEGGFGAEVRGIDLAAPLSSGDRNTLLRAFLDHHLVTVRGQNGLTTDDVLAASRIFGDRLEPHTFTQYHHPDTPLIMVLSNRKTDDDKPKGLRDAGSFWHSDVSYKPAPAAATLLYSLEVPEGEGDTLFCNLTAAYDALEDDMKARLTGLWAVHFYAHLKRDLFESGAVQSPPECRQPVVRRHPVTGRPALYINPAYTVRIEGLSDDESEALKDAIFTHCLQDRFRCRYQWRAGDVVVWDNAALMHSATTQDLDPAKHRTLWRTIISGEPAQAHGAGD